jgi:hypothetical protein
MNAHEIIIEDSGFISDEVHLDFLNKVFSTKDSSVSWRLSNIQTFLLDQESLFFPEKTPTTIVTENSKPIFQIIGDLQNKEYSKIFDSFCEKHSIEVLDIIRARVVITTTSLDSEKHSYPHVDHILDHDVFLYYVNTADGDTVFFDKKIGEDTSEINIALRSSPQSKKAINFNGKNLHAFFLTNKKTLRCILNIEYRRKR